VTSLKIQLYFSVSCPFATEPLPRYQFQAAHSPVIHQQWLDEMGCAAQMF